MVLSRGETDILAKVILDVLTVFIFLEIFHSFLDFLRTKTVEIVDLADITLAIVFREVWIGLFSKELAWQGVMAVALLIVAVGGGAGLSRGSRPVSGATPQPGRRPCSERPGWGHERRPRLTPRRCSNRQGDDTRDTDHHTGVPRHGQAHRGALQPALRLLLLPREGRSSTPAATSA